MSELDTPAPGVSHAGDEVSGDATRVQVRSSTLLLTGQAFAVAVNLLTQILLVRHLSKDGYGTFAFALSVVAIAQTVSGLGLRRAVSRFVPIYQEHHETQKAAGALLFAFGAVAGLGVAVVLLVVGLSSALAGEASEPDAALVLAILVVLAPIQALEGLLDGTFAVFVRPRAIFARRFLYSPLTRLLVVCLLVLGGGGLVFVAAGYVLAGALGLAVYGALLVGVLREQGLLEHMRRRGAVFPVAELLRFATPLLTNDIAGAILVASGAILLGIMAGAEEVAELTVVLPISLTLTYVLTSFGTLFVPLAARMYARGHGEELNRLYWQTAVWTAVFAFPAFAVAFAFSEQLVTLLYGERYASSGAILAVLVLGHFFTAATGPNGSLLAVFGEVRYIVWTNVLAVAVYALLVVAFIAVLGALGAAIAGSAILVLLNGVRQAGLMRRTPVRPLDRRYLGIYAALVLATAALVLVDVVMSPPLLPALACVAAAFAAVLLYARTRLDVGETFPELARIPGLGRLFPTGSPR